MECKLYDIIELGGKPGSGNLVLGEILCFHVSEKIFDENDKIDPFKLDPISRLGYNFTLDPKVEFLKFTSQSIMVLVLMLYLSLFLKVRVFLVMSLQSWQVVKKFQKLIQIIMFLMI